MTEVSDFLEHLRSEKIDLKLDRVFVLINDDEGNGFFNAVTPQIVAEMFAAMDSGQQAAFFNHVDAVAGTWHGGAGALSMQLQHVTDEDGLTLAGRRVMQEIGEYSHWGLVPKGWK